MDLQCDLKNRTDFFTCTGGVDTPKSYGLCIAKPTGATGTPQQLCALCLSTVRPLVDKAVANTTLKGADIDFYSLCAASGYSLAACSKVQALLVSSFNGNLARRAGALCMRLGECSAAPPSYTVTANISSSGVAAATTPAVVAAPVVDTTDNNSTNSTNATAAASTTATTSTANTLTGLPDACTIEGVVGGAIVTGTYSASGELQRWLCQILQGGQRDLWRRTGFDTTPHLPVLANSVCVYVCSVIYSLLLQRSHQMAHVCWTQTARQGSSAAVTNP